MKYEVILSPKAVDDLRNLKANLSTAVRDSIEQHLRHEPTKIGKGRIKRLRGMSRPQYRLRAETVRVFYDVTEQTIEVLVIVPKEEAEQWLEKAGAPDENRSVE